MRDPEFKYYLLVPALAVVLCLLALGADVYHQRMRFSSFIQAQQNVLDCRKVTHYNMMDKTCGEVPNLEKFK